MKCAMKLTVLIGLLGGATGAVAAVTNYVSLTSPGPVPPYISWGTAATNIQDAVDAAASGNLILVSNGVYATGGRVVSGGTTNRVAITNAVTVQSVNGPGVTIIKGAGPLGNGAVRCVYVGTNAVFSGFTVTNGYTQASGDSGGGGILCLTSGVASNCILSGNSAGMGGGACGGTLNNCMLSGNSAVSYGGAASCKLNNCTLRGNSASGTGPSGGYGGGAGVSTLNNCTLSGNSANYSGGGACSCTLNNCAVNGNTAYMTGGGTDSGTINNCTVIRNTATYSDGGTFYSSVSNSIVYYNTAPSNPNFAIAPPYSVYYYSCTTPDPGGTSNITVEPMLVSMSHLATNSPCIGKGSYAICVGVDIDGEAWLNPPSIGCDQVVAGAVTGALSVAIVAPSTNILGYTSTLAADIGGRVWRSVWDFGDGSGTTNSPYMTHAWSAIGTYTVVLTAWNDSYPGGIVATAVVQVVAPPVYYVNLANTVPVYPYTSWGTAATNIQVAVDACAAEAIPGGMVLVTNGVYATGGRITPGGTVTNRLVITNAVTVRSVNGPAVTIIRGQGPMGASAVRCAFLGGGAVLSGFTLTNGFTRTNSTVNVGLDTYGGGACAWGNVATLTNCIISGCSANSGGGTTYGTLNNCTVSGNSASGNGGGAHSSTLKNCTLNGNSATGSGGGAYGGNLNNCAIYGNSGTGYAGGTSPGTVNNCTIIGNSGGGTSGGTINNSIIYYNVGGNGGSTLNYCCNPIAAFGVNNITNEPILASMSHLATNSPCIGKGNYAACSGVDIDGEAWLNPPSIGCDQVTPGGISGALSVAIVAQATNVTVGYALRLTADIQGPAERSVWDFGDGSGATNSQIMTHAWTATGTYAVVLTAWNGTYPAGLATTTLVHVVTQPVFYVNAGNAGAVYPYLTWATAATNIQAAVDACCTEIPGGMVLVTNGVYATGGRAVSNAGTNRLVVTDCITVISVNGPAVTIIRGQGPLGASAVRCAYLSGGAVLSGFTLTNGFGGGGSGVSGGAGAYLYGATLTNCTISGNNGGTDSDFIGGGVAGGSGVCGGTVNNCTINGNLAYQGGGAYQCTLNNCTVSGNSTSYVLTGYGDGGGTSLCTLNNCTISGNSANGSGGGAAGGTLNNCTLRGNSANCSNLPGAGNGSGGGAAYSTLNNCALIGNSALIGSGGGAHGGTLNNCTLSGNSAMIGQGGGANSCILNNCTLSGNWALLSGGGAEGCALSNSIVYYNTAKTLANVSGGTCAYSCTTPDPGGSSNITAVPLLASASHLATNSPCIGKGNYAACVGVDIDGEAWLNPPCMGCDQVSGGSLAGVLSMAIIAPATNVVGYALRLVADIQGSVERSVWDFGDGTGATNSPGVTHVWTATGDYTVVLTAWNASYPAGIAATALVHVVTQPVFYVNAVNAGAVYPYLTWATAATNIQDAVDACSAGLPNGMVLVTNGVYATGGRKVMSGNTTLSWTNLLVVLSDITVKSVNGPAVTIIRGHGPFGFSAVRCAYLGNGAVLSGFTLTNGFTREYYSDPADPLSCGGGAYAVNATLTNCILCGNSAGGNGGGACSGTLINCTLSGNTAYKNGGGAYSGTSINCTLSGNRSFLDGGGASSCTLNNCAVNGNTAYSSGGGASGGTVINSTLIGNSASSYGGGAYTSAVVNSIIYYNTAMGDINVSGGTCSFSCTTPDPGGTANITVEPLLVSLAHLATDSPCIGMGSYAACSGVDIDGEAWLNPPCMGCDQVAVGVVTGMLSVAIMAQVTNVAAGYAVGMMAALDGQVGVSVWDFGDGTGATNSLYVTHAWSTPGDYAVVLTAWNGTYPDGIAATVMVHVVAQPLFYVKTGNVGAAYPYSSWGTAATNIQDAVDACGAAGVVGARVLVTNGVYAAGGRKAAGQTIVSRIVVTNAIIVESVNGSAVTLIKGLGPQGSNAVRCASLGSGAVLSGFTLTNGFTLNAAGDGDGGGAFVMGAATLLNCTISGNSAFSYGGGVRYGTLNNCTLSGNSAMYGGGTAASTLSSCAIMGNAASVYGGGAYLGMLRNCTVSGNQSSQDGGGIWSATAINSIIYYNSTPTDLNIAGGGAVRYSCTTPDPGGVGNITNAPGFVNYALGNLRLTNSSYCVNAGENASVTDTADRDGNPRIQASVVDMGAYESPYAPIDAADGVGGAIISPAGRIGVLVSNDQTFVLSAPPYAGIVIEDVKVDGVSMGATNRYTFHAVTSSHTIQALFKYVYPDSAGFGLVGSSVGAGTGAGTGQVALAWVATNQWTYTLQQTPTLMPAAWSNVVPEVSVAGMGLLQVILDAPTNAPSMFYRLGANYAGALTQFTEADWSQGNFESQANIDTVNSPGQLFLKNYPSNMVAAFTVTQNIYDMVVYRDKLILSDCSSLLKASDAYVHSYDYRSNTVSQIYSYAQGFKEQGIHDMYVWNNKLYTYGPDRDDGGWDLGAIYIYNGAAWTRRLTVGGDVHGITMANYHDTLYLCIAYSPDGSQVTAMKVVSSQNDGLSWDQAGISTVPAGTLQSYQEKFITYADKLALFMNDGLHVMGSGNYNIFTNFCAALMDHVEFGGKLYFSFGGGLYSTPDLAAFTTNTNMMGAVALEAYDGRLYALAGTLNVSSDGSNWTGYAQTIPWTCAAQFQHPVMEQYHGRLYVGGVGSGNSVYVSAAASSGNLVSSSMNMLMQNAAMTWDSVTPAGTTVRFQLRTAKTSGALSAKPFIGPDGTSGTYYQTSGTALHSVHNGDTWVQYKVYMTSTDPKFTPYVSGITLRNTP
ncbi:MAG: PKD domain-containing protein [bacterium]